MFYIKFRFFHIIIVMKISFDIEMNKDLCYQIKEEKMHDIIYFMISVKKSLFCVWKEYLSPLRDENNWRNSFLFFGSFEICSVKDMLFKHIYLLPLRYFSIRTEDVLKANSKRYRFIKHVISALFLFYE